MVAKAKFRVVFFTMVAGFAGALLFVAFGLPAAWLSGGMLGVVAYIMCGGRAEISDWLRDLAMLFAGVAIGCSVTPEMLQAVARYPLSLLFLAVTIFGIAWSSQVVLVRLFGWQREVALVASMPGAMSVVLATAASSNLDMTRVVMVQSLRMLILMAILPSLVVTTTAVGKPTELAIMSVGGFATVMAIAFAIGLAFERMNVLAPLLFAGMAAGGLTHVTGFISGTPPGSIVNTAMFFIGTYAGTRLSGITLTSLRSLFLPALVSFVVTLAVTIAGAGMAITFAGVAPAEALIAFAPGGLEAMMVLGVAMGLDPLYLSSHHVMRFALISFGLPIFANRFLR
ncbi:AbrB Putative ammonia monooxygenase [Rhabdaerophilaceae bacterium]